LVYQACLLPNGSAKIKRLAASAISVRQALNFQLGFELAEQISDLNHGLALQ